MSDPAVWLIRDLLRIGQAVAVQGESRVDRELLDAAALGGHLREPEWVHALLAS